MASAFITWILLVFHYVVVYDPEKASLTHEKNEHPNPVDLKILKWASVIVNRPSKTWEAAVEKVRCITFLINHCCKCLLN
jgi:hypothetical protein